MYYTRSVKLSQIMIRLVVVAFIVGLSPRAAMAVDDNFVSLASNFLKLRTMAYNDVKDLKAIHNDIKPKLQEDKQAYDRAKAAADTWLDTVRISLAAAGDINVKVISERSIELEKLTKNLAVRAGDARVANDPTVGLRTSVIISTIAQLIAPLTDAGIKLYETWSKSDEKQLDKIRAELERLKWAEFEEL